MTSEPLEYWKPGDDERRLRVFISHRYGSDEALYNDVIKALKRELGSVQDISLSAAQLKVGPRGGKLPRLEIQAEIAARIYTSDILIAPSRPAVTRSEWVTWEVQLAAIGYGIPILFVNLRNQQLNAQLVSQVESLGLSHAVCDPDTDKIVSSVTRLVRGHPTWAVRQKEGDSTLRFRGPPSDVLADVLKKLPFEPRLTEIEPEDDPPKRRFWDFLGGKPH